MSDAIRRSHARIPCDHQVEVHHGATNRLLGKGRLLNLSLSGAFLAIDRELQRGTPYRLRVDGPEGPVDLPCRVVREGPRAGPKAPAVRQYGMVFNLSADQERVLRRLLDVLRRQPSAAGEKESGLDSSLRNYWS
jgi:PilZ domain